MPICRIDKKIVTQLYNQRLHHCTRKSKYGYAVQSTINLYNLLKVKIDF